MKGNLPYPALSAGRVVQRPARCCQGPADHVATVMQILQHHKVTQHSGKALQHKVEQRHCTHGLGLIHLQPHISGTRRRQRCADVSASRHPKPYCLSKRLTILNCPQIFDCLRDDPKISSWQEFEQGQQMATTFIEHLLDHDGDFSSPLIKFEENKVLPRVRCASTVVCASCTEFSQRTALVWTVALK